MEFKTDFEEIRPYFDAFWNCEVLDRPALSVVAPRSGKTAPAESWADPRLTANEPADVILDRFEAHAGATFFGGLAVPHYWPNFGPDVFSGFLGVGLNYSADSRSTSWADWKQEFWKDYSDTTSLVIRDDNPLYRKNLELIKKAMERAPGRYVVGATDLHAGFDALCVLRGGPDRASMDLIEYPDGVKAAMDKLFRAWRKVNDDYYAEVGDKQTGSATWIGIWAPGRMYPVQNDFSCLVSPGMYREFFLEELLWEIEYLDYSVYHLDGVEALQHLDILLDIPKLNAIQWVCGARYKPEGIERWLPLYRKIQAKKKAIVVYPEINEIPLVLEQLKPEGLLLQVACGTEEEARVLLKKYGWR